MSKSVKIIIRNLQKAHMIINIKLNVIQYKRHKWQIQLTSDDAFFTYNNYYFRI